MIDPKQAEFMLATKAPLADRPGFLAELKYDGYRAFCWKVGGKVGLRTRTAADSTDWYPRVVAALQAFSGEWMIDAEVCAIDQRGIPDFEALRARRQNAGRIVLYAFDILAAGGRDLRPLPLLDRKERLRRLVPRDHPVIGYIEPYDGSATELYAYAQVIGMEGIVCKRADSPYTAGPSRAWLKTKPADFHALGWQRKKRPA